VPDAYDAVGAVGAGKAAGSTCPSGYDQRRVVGGNDERSAAASILVRVVDGVRAPPLANK
jgi:hypothetical protein